MEPSGDYLLGAMVRTLRQWGPPAVVVLGVAGALALAFGAVALVNYDTLYGLLWGRAVFEGSDPDLTASLAPTQHPLLTAAGVVLAPLGAATPPRYTALQETVVVGGAYLCLGLVAWLVFALGRRWFGVGAGLVAAAIVVTREPILSYGLRAYVDLPFVALVLGALLVETRRPRAGGPVLGLLALAGLLRPEAWLFAALYLAWLWWSVWRETAAQRAAPAGPPAAGPSTRPRRWALLLALTAAGPVLWALSDLLLAGNALGSLTGTRAGAAELGRLTGLANVPLGTARRLGEILREPFVLAAAGGGVLALWRLRTRGSLLGAAAGAAGLLAFAVLAAAGLSILTRYLLFPATILALFAGAGLLGWRRLAREDPWRRPWMAFAAVVLGVFAALVPSQLDRLGNLRAALLDQEAIVADLEALVRPRGEAAIPPACAPLAVPNRRPVPYLALWTGAPAGSFVNAQERGVPYEGVYLRPASRAVAEDFILDRGDLDRSVPPPAPGMERRAQNAAWAVWGAC
ncbi:MAG TPA: hypothetical protein VGV36_07500 [Solirubrobacteraceae bacterium]|nr:hypothetical protein [Solirubrobacteraceae bacterium]